MNKNIYIGTPIYYANGAPHLGHFLTTTAADVLARYYRLLLGSDNVFFTTGLDEHGTTVEQSAIKAGYTSDSFQKYVDKRAEEWRKSFKDTNISFDYFVRTTDPSHEKFAQEFIRKMVNKGDVYQGKYKGKYCNGCEKFLTLSDQSEDGYCPLHRPDQTIEIEEDNYFFKLSSYAPKIKQLIEENKIKITPTNKKQDILSRLVNKIDDISISRPKEKVSWGVGFPDDSNQTVYVWVEALIHYRSSLAINNKTDFQENTVHMLGKDINWFHNVIWPSFLLSTNLPLYKNSFVHSFLIVNGAKISKSLGNAISPTELSLQFGIDGARFLMLKNFPFENDTDVNLEFLTERYNADLANGLGNTVSRVAKLAENSGLEFSTEDLRWFDEVKSSLEEYRFDKAIEKIWSELTQVDQRINLEKPWELQGDTLQVKLISYIKSIRQIAFNLKPFLPQTADKIEAQFKGSKIKASSPLFPRLQ